VQVSEKLPPFMNQIMMRCKQKELVIQIATPERPDMSFSPWPALPQNASFPFPQMLL
jgi:hypothetical protein